MINQPFYGGPPINTQPMPQPNWNQPIMYPMGQMQSVQNVQPQIPTYNPQPRNFIQGRIVNANEDVKPNEVSTDGSISVFPLADRSKVLVKELTGNGTIATTSYVLETGEEKEKEDQDQNKNIVAPILERIDDLKSSLKQNEDTISTILDRLGNIEKMFK